MVASHLTNEVDDKVRKAIKSSEWLFFCHAEMFSGDTKAIAGGMELLDGRLFNPLQGWVYESSRVAQE